MKKQKSGLYHTKICVGYDPQGKPVDKWISGRTKAELDARKRAVLTGYVNGTPSGRVLLFGTAVITGIPPSRSSSSPKAASSSSVRR